MANGIQSNGRRRTLKWLAAGLAAGSIPLARAQSAMGGVVIGAAGRASAPRRGAFRRPLPIPVESTGQLDAAGIRHYRLATGYGTSELVEGLQTSTWGYNGAWLGPTLRVPRDQPVNIHVRNSLNRPTTTHWHGAQVAGRVDGGPHSVIRPDHSWEAAYTLTQPAATLWYHPHPHAYTGPQVYGGLAGMLWVDDGVDAQLKLPHTYGIDDIPVVLQDRRLGVDGQLAYMNAIGDLMGMKGDRFLVNGVEQPYLEAGAGWLRLRLLNASNARNYNIAFADGRRFHVIAGDAGLLSEPTPVTHLLLSSGERAEILVDLSQDRDQRVVLRSDSSTIIPSLYRMPSAVDGLDRHGFDLLELRVGPSLGLDTRLPDRLVDQPTLTANQPPRRFLLNGMVGSELWDRLRAGHGYSPRGNTGPGGMSAGVGDQKLFAINSRFMDMQTIDAHIALGSTEPWQVTNISLMAHPFHMHGTSFLIRSRNGQPPPAHERSWKDVVLVRGGETVELVARFAHPADKHYPFMYHCHILEHEDNGMMGQFVVG